MAERRTCTGANREQLRASCCTVAGEPFALDLPVTRADRSVLWVRLFGEKDVLSDVLRGAVQDITAQRLDWPGAEISLSAWGEACRRG